MGGGNTKVGLTTAIGLMACTVAVTAALGWKNSPASGPALTPADPASRAGAQGHAESGDGAPAGPGERPVASGPGKTAEPGQRSTPPVEANLPSQRLAAAVETLTLELRALRGQVDELQRALQRHMEACAETMEAAQPEWLRDIGSALPDGIRKLLVAEYTAGQEESARNWEREAKRAESSAAEATDPELASRLAKTAADAHVLAENARSAIDELASPMTLRDFIEWARKRRTFAPAHYLSKHGIVRGGR